MDEPINFTYEDTDSYQNEMSELYSYGEESEFFANRNAFEESMEDCGLPLTWKHMVQEQKSRAINYLMTTLEVSCRSTRIKSCRALAYLIQGNFGECLTLEEQAKNSQDNVFLLYEQGLFQAFVQQLLIEANLSQQQSAETNQQLQQQGGILTSQIFTDSSELRLILSVLCTITETMYHAKDFQEPRIQEARQQFIIELQSPIGDELLSVSLFQMLNSFCGGLAPHYPVRKITLLLWKVILITLGGIQTLKETKEQCRKAANLEPLADETLEVTKNMRPCSPPLMPDGQARARTALSGGFVGNKRKVFKQPAFDDAVFAYAKECLLNFAELNHPDMENENSDENTEFVNELNESTENHEQGNSNSEEGGNNNRHPMKLSERDKRSLTKQSKLKMNTSDPLTIAAKSHVNSEDPSSTSDSGITTDDSDSTSSEKTATTKEEEEEEEEEEEGEGGRETEASAPPETDLSDDNNVYIPPGRESLTWTIDALNMIDSKDAAASIDDQPKALSSHKPVPASAQLDSCRSDATSHNKGLPWTPKVRKADFSQHLSLLRQKFLGYTLPNDLETTFGLPDPIIEGVNVLRKYLYISLSEVQLEREETMEKYPLTHKEINSNYRDTPAEKLYNALLPRLPQYMIALLKILLAASTNTKNKTERTESINIMCEVNSDNGNLSIIQTMKMSADANRHKEIIIKSVSAILILLLKHFKVNHIYQFEYVSQQLMFANCIPLILKFLSQDIYSYVVSSKSNISAIDFPACVIGEQPELTTEAIELCLFQSAYCWRNMFSCINLVRILNKLTKWKHSRIMMLVVFKSAPTLTKALSVRHSMFQLYVLKLLKVQLKFLGRQWKKTNMKLISAIYQKVRHRFTDDWAYSNDNEARPWDFQAEEFTLQANINKFHQRRYQSLLSMNGKARNGGLMCSQLDKFGGFDDCTDEDYDFGLGNGSDISQISSHFERNYERWLESEVFQRNVDWDKLLSD